ncbi:enhancer of mRNA decapping [Borealophlyctis nickersoniae]|nr:enhancer of mRNA decapping [Borealophlyctis nickersoniae]
MVGASQSEQDEEEIEYSDVNRIQGPGGGRAAYTKGDSPFGRKSKGRHQRHGRRDGSPGTQFARYESPSPKVPSTPEHGGVRQRKRRDVEAFSGDVGGLSDDFDFQAGLAQFDKRQIFSEIREADSTDPETLLVALNKRRPHQHFHAHLQQKLGVHENVLDAAPSGDETGNDAEVESELESEGFGDVDGTPRDGKKLMLKTIIGVPVPTVTPQEMLEIERIAISETGPSEEQMIENGGRGAAMLVLQALGGGRRIKPGNHNEGPLVVVLAGNNQIGAYGLCAARHLANHECNVIACVVGGEAELINTLAYQQKIFVPTGGKVSKGVVDLPHPSSQPVDLIIDALLGSQQTILDLSEGDKYLVGDLMRWANENKAPVLAIDMPSGINATTGHPVSPSNHVNAKWTLALGLPKTGHLRAREAVGELFLADIGIPRVVFQKGAKAGRVKYMPPFADKFLVGLELAGTGADALQ